MAMIDLIFLELGIAFLIVATVAAVATTRGSQTVRGVAHKAVHGSLTKSASGYR
jgi:hypothetical protein